VIKKDFKISREIFFQYLILAITVWYVVLCIFHYLFQRPLWCDELAVYESVVHFKGMDFFTENLLVGQNFPRLHLFLVHTVSEPFNYSLLSVRFLSFVFMLSAFFLWKNSISREFKDKRDYFVYLLSWCSSAALIYYSAEQKQYSMDVLASAIFVFFLYNQDFLEQQRRKYYGVILFFLPALITMSYPAFFFFVFPLYNLFVSSRKDKSLIKFLVIYVAAILFFSFLAYYFDMRLRKVYGYDDYFIYFTSVGEFFKTLGEGTMNLFSRFLVERPRILKKIILPFFIIGFVNIFVIFIANFKKEKFRFVSVKTIALAVFVEMLILGALKKYPFTVPRTSLYFAPIVLFLTLDGILSLKKVNLYLYKAVFSLYCILLTFLFLQLSFLFLTGKGAFAPLLWFWGITK